MGKAVTEGAVVSANKAVMEGATSAADEAAADSVVEASSMISSGMSSSIFVAEGLSADAALPSSVALGAN